MTTGVVKDSLEPTISLVLYDINGGTHSIQAIIDTGFTGFLTLPSALIAALQLSWICQEQGILADGSTQVFDVYKATLAWDGKSLDVETNAVETTPLIGMGLLENHELQIQVVRGGKISIQGIP